MNFDTALIAKFEVCRAQIKNFAKNSCTKVKADSAAE